jgi:hypothetical protein
MNPWLGVIIGVLAGCIASVALVLVVAYLLLPLIGAGDDMSRGIMSTIVLVFSAPVLAVVGGILGYKRTARKRTLR